MLTFFPGPSKLAEHIPGLYQHAFEKGVGAISHRSKAFEGLYANTEAQIREKLAVPDSYRVFFLGSATECWEVITQSLLERGALHLHSGAFGAKWTEYEGKLLAGTVGHAFEVNSDPHPLLDLLTNAHEALCLTHNETSNGTALTTALLQDARARLGDRLLCLDATSSMAGVELPWELGDVWFASCQKCFGMPAGLSVMVCSQRALERARALGDKARYNSLLTIAKHAESLQNSFTPNVLAIAVLGWHLERWPGIAEVSATLEARAARYYDFVERHPLLAPLITRPKSRSVTTVAVVAEAGVMARMKTAALAAGMQLGNGYGPWKESSFRIANFPAYTDAEQQRLLAVLESVQ